jgi:hypothetical protein
MRIFGPPSGKFLAAKFQPTQQLREQRASLARRGKSLALFIHLWDCPGNGF